MDPVSSSIFPAELFLKNDRRLHENLTREELISSVRERNEGFITKSNSVVVKTGIFTGRTPKDKYVVKSQKTADRVWWGSVNQPITEEQFDRILHDQLEYLKDKELFLQELSVGDVESMCLPITVITETAWHSLFSLNLFKPRVNTPHKVKLPALTIIHTPGFQIDPLTAGIYSGVFIILNLERMIISIAGTAYAGEIKKSVFSVMNYIFPEQKMLTMHCSANLGPEGDSALFFGLSGTGKTTLSSSQDRYLIGDDEHGWMEDGLINLEGGCYAKTIKLKESREPFIWKAANSAGSVLENVIYDPGSDILDFDSAGITENTRAAYPLSAISSLDLGKIYPPPKNIFFLTADAFGILPPISNLDYSQAVYHLLTGYTAKIAATEQGLGSEPCATFSTCFAEPFLTLPPRVYADLFQERIGRYKPTIWLINTGWIKGPYGVGSRIELEYTRAMISAAIQGNIKLSKSYLDPIFGLRIPREVSGVPAELLNPRRLWKNTSAYDQAARSLNEKFELNYLRFNF
jgi:phosphoenolpyruvate carboxykinase (ATP)